MKFHHRKNKIRNEKGNLYILYVGLAAMILVVWNVFAGVGVTWIVSYRSKCALEAASLAAARDLSRIVIDDPRWGYVALTDQPPIGDSTRANDGYPLPVTGINTILATVRLELIVAHAIGTNEAIDCALEDLASARAASRKLSKALRSSLVESRKNDEPAQDIFGNEVHPRRSAQALYERNAADMLDGLGWHLEKLSAELGWLETDGTTNTPIPAPNEKACLDRDYLDQSSYPAFVDVPAFDESFQFAGLGKQVGLVETNLFQPWTSSRNCSIIKLTAEIKKNTGDTCIKAAACAQPSFAEDKVPSSYMVLRFPDGVPSDVSSLRHMLTSRQLSNVIPLCTATGGDYPVDPKAVLRSNTDRPTATVKHTFTRAFFDWLRTAHAKPRLDSIYDALDYQFNRHQASGSYLFSISEKGVVDVFATPNYPFTMQTAYENQLYSVAFDAIRDGGVTWSLRVRDQVHRLGKQHGGKHAGQPMPSKVAVDPNQDEAKRLLATAGSRYDRSRLGLELEIFGPNNTATEGVR